MSSTISKSSQRTLTQSQRNRHNNERHEQPIVLPVISALTSLGLIAVSALVLHDTIQQINGRREDQYSLYPKFGVNFYDQLFPDEIFVILTPILILVAILQFISCALLCLKKSKIHLMLTNIFLFVGILIAFVISIVYKLDTVGLSTHFEANSYFVNKYDKGQALCGILGCDTFILLVTIIYVAYRY